MLTIKIPMLSNFSLGQLVCTNRINDKIEQDNEFKKFVEESLARYTSSDWGDTCNVDAKMNNDAIYFPVLPDLLFSSFWHFPESVLFLQYHLQWFSR